MSGVIVTLPELKLVDLRDDADPTNRRKRWAYPSWLFSLMIHIAAVAAFTTVTLTVAKSIPVEESFDVGIMIKSDTPTATVFETQTDTFLEPKPSDAKEPPPLEAFDEAPTAQPKREALPELKSDISLLATAGQTAREAHPLLAPNTLPIGGGRSRTEFFKAPAVGKSFVWVIDRSASMAHENAIDLAKRELLNSLRQLTPESTFQIIVYNNGLEVMPLGGGKMLKATRPNLDKTKQFLEQVTANGGTEHNGPLMAAFKLQPEVIYFLTDADMMTDKDVANLTAVNRKSRPPATIHTVEFGNGPDNFEADKPLRRLARENDGVFNYVNVLNFSTN